MKNQRYFSHPLLVVAALALASSMAFSQNAVNRSRTGQSSQRDESTSFQSPEMAQQPQTPFSADQVLYSFCGGYSNGYCSGWQPESGVIIDNGTVNPGYLYGTNIGQQASSCPSPGISYGANTYIHYAIDGGTVYEYNPSSLVETVIHTFNLQSGGDGGIPTGGVVQDQYGNLWGTTCLGAGGYGTVFELQANSGWHETFYSFTGVNGDGATPVAGLYLASASTALCPNGCLWGTTEAGGNNNEGTIFYIQLPATNGGAWTETPLYSFGSTATDGQNPEASVMIASDGNLYGTTQNGGVNGYGTAWKYNLGTSSESVLYSFCNAAGCSDGYWPVAGLVEDSSGNLLGTTMFGGSHGNGLTYLLPAPSYNSLTNLHDFAGGSDGAYPVSGLIADNTGNGEFYGTAAGGGNNNTNCPYSNFGQACGVAYEVNSFGSFRSMKAFGASSTDVGTPLSGLTQSSNGSTLYGTSQIGGTVGQGTIYKLYTPCVICIEVNPNYLNWADIKEGEVGPAQWVKVINSGTGVVQIGEIEITGEFALASAKKGACVSGTVLKPKAECLVGATFNPEQMGLLTGQISIMDNADNSPQTVALSGTGVE